MSCNVCFVFIATTPAVYTLTIDMHYNPADGQDILGRNEDDYKGAVTRPFPTVETSIETDCYKEFDSKIFNINITTDDTAFQENKVNSPLYSTNIRIGN